MTGRKGEAAFDAWSFVHFASGLLLGLLPIGWPLAVAALVAYEVGEAALRRIKTEEGGLFEYESWANIGVDLALGLAGFAIVHFAVAPWLPWA